MEERGSRLTGRRRMLVPIANLFVTNLGMGASRVPALPWAGPGLVKIDAGVPGDPLP